MYLKTEIRRKLKVWDQQLTVSTGSTTVPAVFFTCLSVFLFHLSSVLSLDHVDLNILLKNISSKF